MVYSLLYSQAIVILDADIVEETIENTASAKMLGQQLRDKMLSLLDPMSVEPPEVQLKDLFSLMDDDGSCFVT